MVYEHVLANPDAFDFRIDSLGPGEHENPIQQEVFVKEEDRISFSSQVRNIQDQIKNCKVFPSFEKAGPRQKLFHQPRQSRAALITCGGLCPGLNNVIKGVVNVLEKEYGVSQIIGIRYGYKGLTKKAKTAAIKLNSEVVDQIHKHGGTILGSSRGNQDPSEMVDELEEQGINLLFCIGGDGTLKGARAIAEEAMRRNAQISVIGIPKTIDNDLGFVEKTFGFETSVQVASEIITCAHSEAEGAERGLGIVKLMGRDSGFISATASLANSVVDFCLIPEIPVKLDGVHGLYAALGKRLDKNNHAVVVVAEANRKRRNDHT